VAHHTMKQHNTQVHPPIKSFQFSRNHKQQLIG
jgi:hypothetical protein